MLHTNDTVRYLSVRYLSSGFQRWKALKEQWNDNSEQDRNINEIYRELVGDPTSNYGYAVMKLKFRSDFKLAWNNEEYLVHKCALASESQYFQALFQSESTTKDLILPDNQTSKEGFEVFLLFLYTSLIQHSDLKRFIIELYFLCRIISKSDD
jgi:hypothetical protein